MWSLRQAARTSELAGLDGDGIVTLGYEFVGDAAKVPGVNIEERRRVSRQQIELRACGSASGEPRVELASIGSKPSGVQEGGDGNPWRWLERSERAVLSSGDRISFTKFPPRPPLEGCIFTLTYSSPPPQPPAAIMMASPDDGWNAALVANLTKTEEERALLRLPAATGTHLLAGPPHPAHSSPSRARMDESTQCYSLDASQPMASPSPSVDSPPSQPFAAMGIGMASPAEAEDAAWFVPSETHSPTSGAKRTLDRPPSNSAGRQPSRARHATPPTDLSLAFQQQRSRVAPPQPSGSPCASSRSGSAGTAQGRPGIPSPAIPRALLPAVVRPTAPPQMLPHTAACAAGRATEQQILAESMAAAPMMVASPMAAAPIAAAPIAAAPIAAAPTAAAPSSAHTPFHERFMREAQLSDCAQAPRRGIAAAAAVRGASQSVCSYEMLIHLDSTKVTLLRPRPIIKPSRDHRLLGSAMLLRVRWLRSGAAWAYGGVGAKQEQLGRLDDLRQLLRTPVHVAGRAYAFLKVKDAGKGEDEQIWFVAVAGPPHDLVASAAAGGPSAWWTVARARAVCADFVSGCPTVAKLAARMELALSGTTPALASCRFRVHRELSARDDLQSWAALSSALTALLPSPLFTNDVRVVEVDDIYGVEPDGRWSADPSGKRRLMTDGAGMISLDLVQQMKEGEMAEEWCQMGGVPAVLQVRLWYLGFGGKGTLLTTARLPPRTILVRRSQVKVEGSPPSTSFECSGVVEVVRVQGAPHEASSGQFLVPILEAVGGAPVVDALLAIQAEAKTAVGALLPLVASGQELDDAQAMDIHRALEHYESEYVLPTDMLLAGMDTRDEHLRNRVMEKLLQQMRGIAQGKFLIPESANLMAVADPSDSIPQGAIVVLVGGQAWIERRLVLYKPPGCHPGDARCVEAIAPPRALAEHLDMGVGGQGGLHALILSTRGPRSVADMITGSDLDGDVFAVIRNAAILAHWPAQDAEPWDVSPVAAPKAVCPMDDGHADADAPCEAQCDAVCLRRPSELSEEELQAALIEQYILTTRASDMVRQVATLHKAWASDAGARSDECIELSCLYMAANDAPKAGKLPTVPGRLNKPLPYYLKKDAELSKPHPDTSPQAPALSRLWNAISLHQMARAQCCPERWFDPQLRVSDAGGPSVFEQQNLSAWMSKWAGIVKLYRQRLSKLIPKDGSRWTDAERAEYHEIILDARRQLLNGRDPAWEITDELRAEAAIVYVVVLNDAAWRACGRCHECLAQGRRDARKILSFAWNVCGDILLNQKTRARQLLRRPGFAPPAVDPARQVLRMQRKRRSVARLDAERRTDPTNVMDVDEESPI